jgi:hypothetical protein
MSPPCSQYLHTTQSQKFLSPLPATFVKFVPSKHHSNGPILVVGKVSENLYPCRGWHGRRYIAFTIPGFKLQLSHGGASFAAVPPCARISTQRAASVVRRIPCRALPTFYLSCPSIYRHCMSVHERVGELIWTESLHGSLDVPHVG